MKNADQLDLFDKIFSLLSNSASEGRYERSQTFIILFCLIWSYYAFRRERPTRSELEPFDGYLHMKSIPKCGASGIYVFPACDIKIVQNQHDLESRFLPKVRDNLPKAVQVNFHQTIRDYSRRFKDYNSRDLTVITKPYITLIFLLPSILSAIMEMIKNSWVLKQSWSITSLEAFLVIFKSLTLYYSNIRYFQKIFSKNNNLRFVVLSNFYSPENLAIIAMAHKFNIDSFDIQHGVQKNVIAYERLDKFPKNLRPTKIVKWSDEIPPNIDSKELYNNFLNYGVKGKKCLVTLQPSNSDDFLDELNLLFDVGMEVIVRPHPRRNGIAFMDNLKARLHDQIIIRSDRDLPEEFDNCDIHLSEYSSSLLESASVGVLSVALHKIALEYMCNEIIEDKILYFSSLKAFILNIQRPENLRNET